MTGTILKDELSINGELKKCQVTSTTATRPVLILIQTTTLDLLQIETVGDIQQHRSNRSDQSNEKYKTHWIMSDCIEFAHTAEYGSAQLVSGLIVYWHLDDPAMVHTLAVSGFDRLPKLIDLCAGAVHCVALTEEGEVWTWRMGSATALHGQLGYIDSTVLADGFQAQIVEALQGMRMASISAGRQHTMVVSKDGTIYSLYVYILHDRVGFLNANTWHKTNLVLFTLLVIVDYFVCQSVDQIDTVSWESPVLMESQNL
ncbi:hypothetical protein BDEG_24820 [Batrachochytrium dendrobatidis JEL423]|uniref:Uncharacterized protein n=1 Tax=Batrachochytrium dendrobatidis (strain JEL423) TaxID=403673 RepID=A0A177WP96_BATDL|nr:hypothetical protein BDEG_24820 [Batrachochytrium dendrobatidis JEL423]